MSWGWAPNTNPFSFPTNYYPGSSQHPHRGNNHHQRGNTHHQRGNAHHSQRGNAPHSQRGRGNYNPRHRNPWAGTQDTHRNTRWNGQPLGSHQLPHQSSSSSLTITRVQNFQDQVPNFTQPLFGQMRPPILSRSVTIKKSPFYNVHSTLLDVNLMSIGSLSVQCLMKFNFMLRGEQMEKVLADKSCLVQLRFCKLDTMREQPDHFPSYLYVAVNGYILTIPGMGEVERTSAVPLDITQYCKKHSNEIYVRSSEEGKMYVFLVQKLSSKELIEKLENQPATEAEVTVKKIRENLSQDASIDEIAPTDLQCSLLCPLGRTRLKLPCRAATCRHIQCFDAATYIQMNELKPKWSCPVCYESANYDTLQIDRYFIAILEKNTSDDTVILLADGSWKPMGGTEKGQQKRCEVAPKPRKSPSKGGEKTINLGSDDEEVSMYAGGGDNVDQPQERNDSRRGAEQLCTSVETIFLSDDDTQINGEDDEVGNTIHSDNDSDNESSSNDNVTRTGMRRRSFNNNRSRNAARKASSSINESRNSARRPVRNNNESRNTARKPSNSSIRSRNTVSKASRVCSTPLTSNRKRQNQVLEEPSPSPIARGKRRPRRSKVSESDTDESSTDEESDEEESNQNESDSSDGSFLSLSVARLETTTSERVLRRRPRKNYRE